MVTEDDQDCGALQVLLRRLRLAHQAAQRPTYRMIGNHAGLSASTICRLFNAVRPPAWDNLARVLKALGIPPAEIEADWRELWLGAEHDASPIPVSLVEGLAAPGREHCHECGTWIADPAVHDRLHQRLDRLEHLVRALTAVPL
ncbi:helix-turn-helix transcriptional regulator [Actinoplanes sp. NPDC049802]|uniref:helix-turn-helix domain-containing protein n=1 Tax=Actinoplanes sp. NPDC049802 TaxID=3154742 RepID=UPI0033CAAC20